MVGIKTILADLIEKAVSKSVFLNGDKIALAIPEEQFGDFTTNVALISAKKINENPIRIAKKIKEILLKNEPVAKLVANIEIVKPGFINFTLRHEVLIRELINVNSTKNYGYSKKYKGRKAIIDYSSPNIAKQFSIAHLRSTIMGQAVFNLLKSQGYNVVGINHLGDWGTQFGKLIVAIKRWNPKPIPNLTFDELEELYVRFHKEVEENASLIIEAREAFKKLENGSKEEKEIWQQLITISLNKFNEIYKLLGVKIDFAIGESFYLDKLEGVINDAKTKSILEESQGAKIVKFDDQRMTPALLKKSDGASTYCLRDLAAIKYRKERWNPDLFIYEVGDEQKLHFDQVFQIAARLGYGTLNQFVHIAHGEIRTPEGRMSTRKGNTVKLNEVLTRLIEKARIMSPNDKTATSIGICALKFDDLKRSPSSHYIFNWDEMLSLEGNTGPYLQYAYVRALKILKKSGVTKHNFSLEKQLNQDELRLIRKIIQFSDVTLEAAERLYPPLLCIYLYNLSQTFNTFYNNNPILKAGSSEQKSLRLALTQGTKAVLKTGMKILGLPTVQQM